MQKGLFFVYSSLNVCLKGQRHEIFDHSFALKVRPGPHMNIQTRFREDIGEIRVSA